MIPKIIHYCRFGGNPMPIGDVKCVDSWKKMHPDYEFMLWDESIFDLKNDFLEELYDMKKWACYTEFVRYYALKEYGGIYFDTDMLLLKDLNPLLKHDFFIGFETEDKIGVSAIGSIPGNPILDELLEYYYKYKKGDKLCWSVQITGPIFARYTEVKDIGKPLEYAPNSYVYPPEYFYSLPYELADIDDKFKFVTENSYSLHFWNASWVDEWKLFWTGRYKTAWKTVGETLKKNPFQHPKYFKNLLYHTVRQITSKKTNITRNKC